MVHLMIPTNILVIQIVYLFFLLVLFHQVVAGPKSKPSNTLHIWVGEDHDLTGLFRVMPIIALRDSCVPLMMEIRADVESKLAHSAQLEHVWRWILVYSFGLSGMFYIFTGLFGYVGYGARTKPNVLRNLQDSGGSLAALVNFLFATSLVVSYPLICFVVRQPFRRALATSSRWLATKPEIIFSLEAMIVCTSTLVTAIAVPGIDVVLEFIGGTAAVFVNYLAPVGIFFLVRPESFPRRQYRAACIALVGTTVSIITLSNLASRLGVF